MSATLPPVSAGPVRRPRRRLRFTHEGELVRLVRAGDERAFEAIYDRHHRGILSFCRHMLGSREEAEDAVQHTFAAAYRDLAGSQKPIHLKAWLYTIARNRSLSVLRARREERALDDVPEPSVEGLGAAVQRRQDLRDMLADLRTLPDDQRAALVLSELGALTHDEIAMTLDVRKDKVKALVFQAREALAKARTAREADCGEIQEQLAVLRGGALRRSTLRRHVEVCAACSAFQAEVKRQRAAMACLLPVVPSVALKQAALGAALGGAAGGGLGVGGGLLAASSTKVLVAKVAAVAVMAGGATGGGLKALDAVGGGAGGPDVAAAALPDERRAIAEVGELRRHAERAAAERASGGTPPEGAAAKDRPRADRPAAAPGPRARPVRRRVRGTARRDTVAAAVPRSGTRRVAAPERSGGEPPRRPARPAPASAPAVSAPPAPAPAPAPGTEEGGKRGRGHEKARGRGHRHHPGDPVVVQEPPGPPEPRKAEKPPKPARPAGALGRPVPAVPQIPSPAVPVIGAPPAGDDGPGRRRGRGQGRGRDGD